jgi:probable rRNA maturation factor
MKPPLKIDIDIACQDKIATLDCIESALECAWEMAQTRQCLSVNEVAVKIVSREEMQQLNKLFRDKDYPTNVLAFPSHPIPGVPNNLLGDIAICAQIVWEEANQQKTPLSAHWAHLAAHGLLHLLGYDHETDDQADVMQALEIKVLQELGWPNPYLNE